MIPAGPLSVELADHGDMVVHKFRTEGGFETKALEAWTDLIQEGDIVIDVGAYSGVYAIAAAKRGAVVHAFEPLAAAFVRLLRNADSNSVVLRAYPKAVGSKNGREWFIHNDAMHMTSGGALEQFASRERTGIRRKIQVEVVRLDRLIDGKVAAIKIDAEGGELEVLKGAAGMLAQHRPAIIVELLSEAAEAEVGDWLRGRGYVGQPLDDRNWLFEN